MCDFELKWIKHNSPCYQQAIKLRRQILRLPLGLDFTSDQLNKEATDLHLVAYKKNDLVGCLVLTPQSKDLVQMRQVAVETKYQGLGIGRILVGESEKKAKELGYKTMMLHSRKTAIGFYQKLGYSIRGELFIEVGIPHVEMEKSLAF